MHSQFLLRFLLAAAPLFPVPVLGQGEPDRLTELVRQTAEELRSGPDVDGADAAHRRLRQVGARLGLDLPPFRPEEEDRGLESRIDSLVAAGDLEASVALGDDVDEGGRTKIWALMALVQIQDRFGFERALEVALQTMRRPQRAIHSIVARRTEPPFPWDTAILDRIAATPLDEETRAAATFAAMGAMAVSDPDAGWNAVRGIDLGTEAGAELALWILIGLHRGELRRPYADSVASALIDALPRLHPNLRASYTTSVVDHCTGLDLRTCDRAGIFTRWNPASFDRDGTPCEVAEKYWDAVIEQNRRMESAGAPPGRASAFRATALAQGAIPFFGGTCDPRGDSLFLAWTPDLDAAELALPASSGEDLRVHLALAWASRDPDRARGPASRIVDIQSRDSVLAEVVARAWDLAPLPALDLWSELATGPARLPVPEPGAYGLYRSLGRDDDAEALLSTFTESARFEARMAWARVLLEARRHDDARRLALRAIVGWTPTPEPPSLQRPWDTLVRLGLSESLIDRVAAVDDPVARGSTLAEVVAVRLNRR